MILDGESHKSSKQQTMQKWTEENRLKQKTKTALQRFTRFHLQRDLELPELAKAEL